MFAEQIEDLLGQGFATDRYSLGRDFPRIAEIRLASSLDGRFVLALGSALTTVFLLAPGSATADERQQLASPAAF